MIVRQPGMMLVHSTTQMIPYRNDSSARKRRTLDQTQVVRAALALLDEEGMDELTMRRLADRLPLHGFWIEDVLFLESLRHQPVGGIAHLLPQFVDGGVLILRVLPALRLHLARKVLEYPQVGLPGRLEALDERRVCRR